MLSSLRHEWAGQEKRMRNEHQVPDTVSTIYIIYDLNIQEHAQGLLEEIEDLLMTNKLFSKEKEEQKTIIEEGNRKNLAMKRNIKEVRL